MSSVQHVSRQWAREGILPLPGQPGRGVRPPDADFIAHLTWHFEC